MTDQPWYKDWFNSPFYHKLYIERNDKEAENFIDQLIQYLRPVPGSRMLDTHCGKGQHSQKLASLGFTVTGIDMATDNIADARRLETDELSFFEHDIRLPFWGNYYDYIFNFFTRFGYYRTRREHEAAIRTLAASMKPGGILTIDYLNTHYAEEHLLHHELKKIGQTSYEFNRWDNDTHFYNRITISDPSLASPLEYTEQLAKFSLGDFTDMFSYQGLQVQEVFGDYRFGHYDIRKTPRLIIVAEKKTKEPADKEKRLYSDGRKTDALT